MLSQSTSFTALVVVLLFSSPFCCSADNVYCVTPTLSADTSCSSCPPDSTHCTTLSEYAQETELYFTSNTTMVFLPGDHTLNVNITVANISRLALCGEFSSGYAARVVCNGSVGFSFISVVDLKTHFLTFTTCGRKFGHSRFITTLLMESIKNVELVNCSFRDSIGTALTVYDTNITLAENSEFTHGGGGITALGSRLTLTGNTTFIGNDGSAVINVTNCSLSSTGSIHFISNSNKADSEHPAAAIWASTSSINFAGISNFIKNFINISSDSCIGGAIVAQDNTSLSFTGTSNFINNSAAFCGGAILVRHSMLSFTGTNNFINNWVASGSGGGAIAAMYGASLSFNGSSNFIRNSADRGFGGAIIIEYQTSLSFTGTSMFISNSAHYGVGGAIYSAVNTILGFSGFSQFINNSVGSSNGGGSYTGGAIAAMYNTTVRFAGTSNFFSNSADRGSGGAIIAVINVSLSFTGDSNFINNSAGNSGGAIFTSGSTSLHFTGTTNFINNSVGSGSIGGTVAAYYTSLRLTGTSNFINNSAPCGNGGGVYLRNSTFSILPNTTSYWENNHAGYGGAIYVEDKFNPFVYCYSTEIEKRKDRCFFQLSGQNLSHGIESQFVFKNNSADVAGDVLYGGAIDNCTLTGWNSYSSVELFDMLFHIENDSTSSSISSDPFRMCLCEDNRPYCGYSDTHTVYPGETFHVSLVAVGQRDGTVPTAVRSHFKDATTATLQRFQYTQITMGTCTKLNYTVFSLPENLVQLELYADGPCSTFSNKVDLKLFIHQTCPPGFNLSKKDWSCICEQRLEEYTTHCYIIDGLGQITRDSHDQFWVGYDQLHGLILHPHCPLDYCVSYTVEFPLNNTDLQCSYNRSGLLCGACKKGYSLVLGTSQCEQCTNNHLILLVPFALMGIALVLLLLICKLTVATGTLSGVVLYANIVGINRNLLLPVETTHVLSVFIAWLNLDFGVETCFYNGMDVYSKTWLQFVFPVYIWMIVGLLILVSHFSDKFAKLLGNNPVSVLATLILLSYAKILHTIIAAINVTYLEYPMYSKGVWLYDANINYLSGKHIPLFLVAMCFLFLFLPYTLLLLFGQWLQAISHLRLFAWVNRLKPILDSYQAPYRAKHRYWPGLLLVLRFSLLSVIFAVNPQQDPSINLLAILVGTGILTIWAWISGGVYRNWCLNALESSFALNLIILAAATYHVKLSGGSQLAVGYTSVIIALVTFIGILAYHTLLQVRGTKLCKMFPKLNDNLNFDHSLIEPVKDTEGFEDSSQLREPLLEDPPQPNYGAF